jgi:hydrogenase nickel incorporation protein HypA/HybF
MHELSITTDLIQEISDHLKEKQPFKVMRVTLDIGVLTAILPDAIRFCFDLCAKNTPLEGASLEINEIKAYGICKSCEGRVETSDSLFVCPCGNAEIGWERGQELKIKEIEVE